MLPPLPPSCSQLEGGVSANKALGEQLCESSPRCRALMEISAAVVLSLKNQQREHAMGDLRPRPDGKQGFLSAGMFTGIRNH